MTCRIAIDVGGTFTDLVCLRSDGEARSLKLPSTPEDYSQAILDGISQLLAMLDLQPEGATEIVHGTTVATNTILEQKGARTALITTAGFRDVLELRRIRIPELYDLFYRKPQPLVPRNLRFEVEERLGPGGVVWRPLNGDSVQAVVEQVRGADVQAVAVCLLHSYANPDHERVVAAAVSAALPEIFVTCSAGVLGEIREYERTSTTVINAYVGPVVKGYLVSLRNRLMAAGFQAPLLLMQCSGGVITVETAIDRPAYLVESGPAAGVKAAAALAQATALPSVITLDMGGTTAKASAIEQGTIPITSEYEVGAGINVRSQLVKGGGHALRVPVIDISEIGAGGGSLVWVDQGGRLHVGPESAGSAPGPAAYGAGGSSATVTDAHIVLGFTNPERLAGGVVSLDAGLAADAVRRDAAEPLGVSILEAAHGIHTVACTAMMRAVKAVSTFRGRDPREATLVVFGGNGPVVGADMARELGMTSVLVPPRAGVFSALGLLHSDVEMQLVRSFLWTVGRDSPDLLGRAFDTLELESRQLLERQGFDRAQIRVHRSVDARYENQGYELPVMLEAESIGESTGVRVADVFEREHEVAYGHRADGELVQVAAIRVTTNVASDEVRDWSHRWELVEDASQRVRDVYFGRASGLLETPVLTRAALAGELVDGPVIIEESDTSTVVPPGARCTLDVHGNILITVVAP